MALPLRQPFTDYFARIIAPAARDAGLTARTSAQIYSTGSIIHDIWTQIWQASVVIADVTGKNPNVNYELGICHALGVPTIIVSQNMSDVPFDYRHRRCIIYKKTRSDWQTRLRKKIRDTITETMRARRSGKASSELPWPYDTRPENTMAAKVTTLALHDAIRACTVGKDAVRKLRIFAFNSGTIFEFVRDQKLKIGTCHILLPRFEHPRRKTRESKLNEEVERFVRLWKGLQRDRRIQNLDIRYYDHLPSHYCCIFGRSALLLGTYTLGDWNPSTDFWKRSHDSPLVIANADRGPEQTVVIQVAKWFDGVWQMRKHCSEPTTE